MHLKNGTDWLIKGSGVFLLIWGFLAAPVLAQDPTEPVENPTIWVNLHGAHTQTLEELIHRGKFPADGPLRRLWESGVRAAQFMVPLPALTSSGRASTLTGRPPAAHGIVGNSIRFTHQPDSAQSFGYDSPFAAEPLWEAAQRQGKRVTRMAPCSRKAGPRPQGIVRS